MTSLAPALNILARIMVGYGFLFLVPMAWAWQLDAPALLDVWLQSMAITQGLGLLLWLLTRSFHRELMPRDGFVLRCPAGAGH
jgi:trk system potassium uptake protein